MLPSLWQECVGLLTPVTPVSPCTLQTQNVTDVASSKAFMTLAARFPAKRNLLSDEDEGLMQHLSAETAEQLRFLNRKKRQLFCQAEHATVLPCML